MKTMPTLLVFCFMLLHTARPMDIKTFKFEHFDLEDGFSGMRVLCIYQDRQDFLWFSTLAGLNRYDGYEVKEFLYQPGDSASISHSQVNAMAEDDQGNLWLATGYAGLNKPLVDPIVSAVHKKKLCNSMRLKMIGKINLHNIK